MKYNVMCVTGYVLNQAAIHSATKMTGIHYLFVQTLAAAVMASRNLFASYFCAFNKRAG